MQKEAFDVGGYSLRDALSPGAQSDADPITDTNRYFIKPSQRLVVGKYVPDPESKDICNPKRAAATAESADCDGPAGASDADNEAPSKAAVAPQVELPPPQWDEATVSYRLVRPSQPTSAGTLFFPVHYPAPSVRDKQDPKGLPADINTKFHGAPDDRKIPTDVTTVKRANLNKVALFKIGPGAVAFKVVLNALEAGGLQYTPSNDLFNILWAKRGTPEILEMLNPYQKVNHIPGTWGVGRKDSLARNVGRMRDLFGSEFGNIVPRSFLIPGDLEALQRDLNEHINNPSNPSRAPPTYIVKPSASSCGKGIKLYRGMPPMPKGTKTMVCQRYVGNPMLVLGRKFDLRMYCCITGFDPLRIYLFDQGLVRFAAEPYPGEDKELESVYAHLTNYSISKTSVLAKASKGKAEDGEEAVDIKWTISDLQVWLRETHGAKKGDEMWAAIHARAKAVVVKSFLSIEAEVISRIRKECKHDPTGNNCFELYGLDLMVDANLDVTLIEVNIMPSLATGANVDKAVKARMLANLLTLVGVVPHVRHNVADACQDNTSAGCSSLVSPLTEADSWVSTQRFYYSSKKGVLTGPPNLTDVPLLSRFDDPSQPLSMLTPGERRMLSMADEELRRGGGFERIFPTATSSKDYFRFFSTGVLRSNFLLASWEQQKAASNLPIKQI